MISVNTFSRRLPFGVSRLYKLWWFLFIVDAYSGGGVGRFVRQVAWPVGSLHGCAGQTVNRALLVGQM